MDKVWIISPKNDCINDGPDVVEYDGLVFTSKKAANDFLKTMKHPEGLEVKELNLHSEYLV